MTAAKVSATFANVQIADGIEIEGLQSVAYNGVKSEYFVSVQQLVKLFSINHEHASRDVKRLLGKGSRLTNLWVIRSSTKISNNAGRQSYDNCVTIPQFTKIILELTIKGDETAKKINYVLMGVKLEERFDKSFGIKYTEEKSQSRIEDYSHIWEVYRKDAADGACFINNYIQHYCFDNDCPEKESKFRVTFYRTLCMGLFGKYPCHIAVELGIDEDEKIYNRNFMNGKALERIHQVQELAIVKMEQGYKPFEAVKAALNAYSHDVIEYRAKRFLEA